MNSPKNFGEVIKINDHRRTTCRLCERKTLECMMALTDTPVGDAYVSEDQI